MPASVNPVAFRRKAEAALGFRAETPKPEKRLLFSLLNVVIQLSMHGIHYGLGIFIFQISYQTLFYVSFFARILIFNIFLFKIATQKYVCYIRNYIY